MKLPNQENLLSMAVQNSKSKIHQWCLVSLDYTQWHRNLLARNSIEVDSPLTYYPMVTHKRKGGFDLSINESMQPKKLGWCVATISLKSPQRVKS